MNDKQPKGWESCDLGTIAPVITKGTTPTTLGFQYQQSGVAFIKVENLENGGLNRASITQYISGDCHKALGRSQLHEGDLLFSIAGTIGKVALVQDVDIPANTNQAVAIIRGFEETLVPTFLRYQLESFATQSLKDMARGGAMNNISLGNLSSHLVLIAPLNEQRRIADKLDQTLAIVERAKARLARVPEILKQFRQSVLAAATDGRLTEDWRPNGRESQANGLPKDWTVCQVKDAGKIQLGRQRSPKFHAGENMRPYLRVQNVFEDRIDLSDVMQMAFPGYDVERYQLHPGDILLNEGQSPEYLGRPAMYRGELPGACFTNTLIRFQAYDHVKPDFALLVFRNHMHSGRYSKEGTITTNIAHLGAGRFGTVEFPVPSLDEQLEIVRRVETLIALADRIEARYQVISERVDKLTQSLLTKA